MNRGETRLVHRRDWLRWRGEQRRRRHGRRRRGHGRGATGLGKLAEGTNGGGSTRRARCAAYLGDSSSGEASATATTARGLTNSTAVRRLRVSRVSKVARASKAARARAGNAEAYLYDVVNLGRHASRSSGRRRGRFRVGRALKMTPLRVGPTCRAH